jgi:hypothetical protein
VPGPAASVPVHERLKKGAEILGKLWREGIRCGEEWSVLCPDGDPFQAADCFCEPKNKFCNAKKQWLSLVIDDVREEVVGPCGLREIQQGQFGLIETMAGTEWDATGMTVKFDFPGVGSHGIGPKGIMGRADLVKLFEAPDTLRSIILMMSKFPGIKVQEVLPAEAVGVIDPDDFVGT